MPVPGDVVAGKYRIERVAGEGGMGVVFAAQHMVLGQRVALKVLFAEAAARSDAIERFAREVQAAARIKSPHVAHVLDAGATESGLPFLAMELLEGKNLEELLEERKAPLPVQEVANYMLQALEAVGHAHALGIVHRDLKPPNLFVAERPDGSSVLKILDFGISKTRTATRKDKVITGGQTVLGSPAYMSPEQLRNASDIDARADIWSLGAVMYELSTCALPFDADGVGELFAAVLEREPVPPCSRNPELPTAFGDLILRCLRKKPEDRFANAAELAQALVPYATDEYRGIAERLEQLHARASESKLQSEPEPADTDYIVRQLTEPISARVPLASIVGTEAAPKPPAPANTVARRSRSVLGVAVAFGVAIAFTAGLGALVRSRGNAQSGGAVIAPRESASVTASAASSVPLVASAEPLVQDAGTAVEPDASAQAAPSASVRRTNPPPKRPVRPKFLSTPD
jgi:serine/threonine-protein kinase